MIRLREEFSKYGINMESRDELWYLEMNWLEKNQRSIKNKR
jgi:hypothetical protein